LKKIPSVFMYAMNIQNDVIGLVLRQNCKSKQVTDFIAWPNRCHVTIHENREILCWKQVTENTINWKNGEIWKKKIKKYCKIQSPWPIGVLHDYFLVGRILGSVTCAPLQNLSKQKRSVSRHFFIELNDVVAFYLA
jgi:hypothetical protein